MNVASSHPQEFLTFSLGGEEYAIDILKVQEIRRFEAVTRIANAPAFIKGVVNLRGTIVPIVDLRVKFSLSEPRYDEFTVVIVLNVGSPAPTVRSEPLPIDQLPPALTTTTTTPPPPGDGTVPEESSTTTTVLEGAPPDAAPPGIVPTDPEKAAACH